MMNKRILISVAVAVIFSVLISVHCDDNEIDIHEQLNKLRGKFPNGLPPGFPNGLPPGFPNGLPPGFPPGFPNSPNGFPGNSISADEVKQLVKEKCVKQSGNDSVFASVEEGAERLKTCLTDLVDPIQLQQEIEAAQPKGELDTVFNKYCRKRTIAFECVGNFTKVLEPCLEPAEIDGQKTLTKIITNILNFVCYKDGDKIALFIAEKGPECISSKKDKVQECFNKTVSKYLPEESTPGKPLPAIPKLVLGHEQCNDIDKLEKCVVHELEQCKESTPANLVGSLFKFIRNETICAPAPGVHRHCRGK